MNVNGFFLTGNCILPAMVRRGGGSIVNVSSVASITAMDIPMVAYATSKAAVSHFIRAVVVEYAAKGIRCNAVLPGLITTPMVVEPYEDIYSSIDDMIAKRDAMVPMGKMGTAWDVAHASLFRAYDPHHQTAMPYLMSYPTCWVLPSNDSGTSRSMSVRGVATFDAEIKP